MTVINRRAPMENGTVILRRTFNLGMPLDLARRLDPLSRHSGEVRFWRVVGPANHKNLNSDLSLEGLREWRII
jgi:hypothetical protein